jgi:hypothetical protein
MADMTAPLRTERLMNAAPMRGPGERTPQTLLLLDESARLIREAVSRFFPNVSRRGAAKRFHGAAYRYSCGAWIRDRAELTCPARHRGKVEEYCWRLLKTVNRVPGESSIRQIISRRGIR